MRRILTNMAFGLIIGICAFAAYGYWIEHQIEQQLARNQLSEDQIRTIEDVTKELQIFAESLPDCSKGFPTGARKEIWDNYIRFCEPGVIVPKGAEFNQ